MPTQEHVGCRGWRRRTHMASGLPRQPDRFERLLGFPERAKVQELSVAELEHPAGSGLVLDTACLAPVMNATDEHHDSADTENVVDVGPPDLECIVQVAQV